MHSEFVENIPFPCFVLDQQYRILTISAGARAVFSVEITGSFIDVVDPAYQDEAQLFLDALSQPALIEIPLLEKWGSTIYQIYKTREINSGNLHVFCIPVSEELAQLRVAMDKMEKKMTDFNMELIIRKEHIEKKVQEIQHAEIGAGYRENIGKLAAGIAHEIRNPLTTVKGFIQLLKPQLKELGKEQYANVALDELNRANTIIYEFLNAAKPRGSAGRETTFNTLIKEIILLFESESILRNISLVSSLSKNDSVPPIEPSHLKQVLVNIVKNAMEAIDSKKARGKKEICIFTENDGKDFTIRISDNGCGMDKETLESLFTPFFSTKEKGTGIGLNVSKKIVEDAGGRITVESVPDFGTTFLIVFPVTRS